MKNVDSNTQLEGLSNTPIGISAEYTFSNPYSINGPFGNFTVILSATGKENEHASGVINIYTLFGLGSTTHLIYSGKAEFNGSTGYTTIQTTARGEITVRPNPPRHLTTEVTISLAPGFHEGEISIEGFGTFPCKATKIHYIEETATV